MFKSEKHNVFTEEINKIALSSNNDKRMQSTDSIETYVYGASKDLVSDKKRLNVTIKKMINFDDVIKEKNKRT